MSIERLCHLQSKAGTSHGATLNAIHRLLSELSQGIDVFVRERAFSRFPHETQALFKVIGIADLIAWQAGNAVYSEIAPTTVKKLLVGSGKATKQEVAASLEAHVGRQEYATDDESDAVAVGVAWIMQQQDKQQQKGGVDHEQ